MFYLLTKPVPHCPLLAVGLFFVKNGLTMKSDGSLCIVYPLFQGIKKTDS